MNAWIRKIHRFVSIVFTLTVIVNIAMIALDKAENPPGLITFSPLPFLFVLIITGLYLFALPYMSKGRATSTG